LPVDLPPFLVPDLELDLPLPDEPDFLTAI
jgi:hypothetical protein